MILACFCNGFSKTLVLKLIRYEIEKYNIHHSGSGFSCLMASCDDDEGTTPNEEEEEMTSAPNGWVLVEADSFFVASASALPGGSGPYRY